MAGGSQAVAIKAPGRQLRHRRREVRGRVHLGVGVIVRRQLLHLRTMHLGPEEVLVGMKLIVDDRLAVADAAQFVDVLEARLRAELPILKRIYVENGSAGDRKPTLTAST